MSTIDVAAMSDYARRMAETASNFTKVIQTLVMGVRDSYRPELHYMRGPGPKWRAKHQPWLKFNPKAGLPTGQDQRALAYARHRNPANHVR